MLADGSTARLRPIKPNDEDLLVEFYSRVSPESKYLRFFAPYPVLSDNDVYRFTHVDYDDRVAFILMIGGEMVAVGRYDKVRDGEAEVAFLVEDSLQGKGVGTVLLEHLAQAGRERHMRRFVAEVLPQNRRMAKVFSDAGYTVTREFEDGMILVEFPILPTETSVEVMQWREHRAEATSVRRILQPSRVAVYGEAWRVQSIVNQMLDGGFRGKITAVPADGKPVNGVPVAASVVEVEGDIDVVVAAVGANDLPELTVQTAAKKAFGMVVLHSGEFGGDRNRDLVALVRSYGLRALGPDALGVMNTAPDIALNATPAPMARRGVVGLFSQSSAVGVILLSTALENKLGLANFVSSGIYADVTSNDVMQYWIDDVDTEVCLLSLDRIGNPRKFSRISRMLATRKPVVLYSPGRSERVARRGTSTGLVSAPAEAIDSMFRQNGIIVASHRDTMYHIAMILARQPLPRGDRVRVITNSPTMSGLVHRVGTRFGLNCDHPIVLPSTAAGPGFADEARKALQDPGVDSVVCAVVDMFNVVAQDVYYQLSDVAAEDLGKPLIGVFADFVELEQGSEGRDGPGILPVFRGYSDALTALGAVTSYGTWRASDHGIVPEFDHHPEVTRAVIDRVLAEHPEGRELDEDEIREILGAFDIEVLPLHRVDSVDEAILRAADLGWDVVLKATDPSVCSRPDQASVFRHIDNPDEMRDAWEDLGLLCAELELVPEGDTDGARVAAPLVQPNMPTGVPLELTSREDPAFGPIVSLGLQGLPSELLDDVVYRVPPLTTVDVEAMVGALKAAPLFFGYRGTAGVDIVALEGLIHQLAQLADAFPQLAEVVLTPCMVAPRGVWVAGARIVVAPAPNHRDAQARHLTV